MSPTHVHITLDGRISDQVAELLGGCTAETNRGQVLIAPFVDHAQLSGLLVQLCDLHLGFARVAVRTSADPSATDEGALR